MSDRTFYLGSLVVMCVSIWALAKVAGFLARNNPWRGALHEPFDIEPDDTILLTHEATPDVDEFGSGAWWKAREKEFADLNILAKKLGGAR